MLYRFGDFTVDDATRQLLLKDAEVHVSPKGFDLLTILLENRSRAVSKAELQQRLWPTTFVEETNIAGLVAEIRRALHDPASKPLFVRTVYGFGYRFIGDVRTDETAIRSGPGRSKLYLVSEQREMMLMEGANVIGRAADATIQIDAPGVSRYHARILVAGLGATLEDVESKNGTYLNGTRITASAPLSDGNEIRFGRVVLTFRIATATSPTATLSAPGN
ncbi:MAG TPA: FHA domain-containing protein [Vicinamibacterales bacterium]|nr:FHA domain-containing protein [Vicinamibacterales bacterium]